MKIAIVHDDLVQWGGAERVVLAMHNIWPEAPIYTSLYLPEKLPLDFRKVKIITSFMQKLPFKKQLYKFYLLLYPLAFESFNFNDFDIVISSSTRFAHGVITKPTTTHIWYCHTPSRYLWLDQKHIPAYFGWLYNLFVPHLKTWDKIAARRTDFIIANSKNVSKKIKELYNRDSEVIYPFVDLEKFSQQPTINKQQPMTRDYFLIVTRLVPWKRVDIAVRAFNKLGWPLIIIGEGPDKKFLQKIAKPNVRFMSGLTDMQLADYYRECIALINTQEEDLGIVPLEVNAAGKPVIAYNAGGALETIIPGKNGEFFYPQTSEALLKAVENFKAKKYKADDCYKQARKFNKEIFKSRLRLYVKNIWKKINKI